MRRKEEEKREEEEGERGERGEDLPGGRSGVRAWKRRREGKEEKTFSGGVRACA